MPVEITDEEASAARRAIQLINILSNNPEAKTHLERSLKVVEPKYVSAEDISSSITKPVSDELAALKAELAARDEKAEADKKERDDAEAVGRLEQSFQRLRGQGLTAEGEEKVKEIMRDRMVLDPEAAFALFEKQNPKVNHEQSSWSPDSWNYDGDLMPDTKSWFNDPEKAADDAIGQVLIEERRRAGGDS